MAEPAGWRPPWEDARTAGVPSAPPDGSRDPQAGRGHFRRYGRPGRWARGPGGPLRRAREDRLVGGVAAAIANRIGRDVTTVRIVLVVAAVLSGGFVAAAYIVAWMLIPMAGTEHSVAGKALTDRRGLALVAGFWSVLIVIRVLGEAFHAGWLGSLLWPLAIAGAGLVLIWRNAPEDEQAMIRHQVQPLLGLTTGSRRAGLILRLTVAVILLAGGIVALQSAHENIALLQPLAGVALLISAIVVLLGPWWLRIARDLVLERQARVRAEERADIAARVHDSVLQTLALIQRRADDPQKVVQLARLQERELRSWRSEGREPNEEAAELTVAAGVRHIQQDGELGVLLVRFPALEQPGAQLAFLQPGQLDDLLRVVRAPLDQRERLQHRVVHPGRDVGPLLRAHPGLALQHQVAGDPQPPRAEEQHDGRDHQHHPAERAQQRHAHVRREQPAHPADEQHAGQHQAKRGPPAAGPGTGGRWSALRLVLASVLLIGGVGWLFSAHMSVALLRPLGGVVLVIAAIVLFLGPWWLRIARDLVLERQARVRAEERADIAARVHDSVLQTLALIQRRADDPQKVVQLARLQERELRSWLFEGRSPGEVDAELTLTAGVRQIQQDVEASYGVPVEAVTVGDCGLDDSLNALLAAAREATVNAAKWSGASVISLFAEVEPGEVSLVVRDRGQGFDPESIPADRKGLTESVHGRMTRRGGTATVTTAPGEGTKVTLKMPRTGAQSRPSPA